MPHAWLASRYWPFSWALLVLALPLAILLGGREDVFGIGAYALYTAACHGLERSRRGVGLRFHLVGMVPYWAWYASLEAGLPARFGHGAPGFVTMLMFPILVITALTSSRGVIAIAACSYGAVFHRFGWSAEAAIGVFLVSLAVLIGFVFRLPVRNLERSFEALERVASRDALTDLSNRRGLDIAFARRQPLPSKDGFVLLLDLVRFRAINDGFGHGVGDALLSAVADRIRAVAATSTEQELLVARVDGDEFAVTCFQGSLEEATRLADALVESLSESFQVKAHVLHLEANVGIACIDGTSDPSVLLGRARQALYAGRAGREQVTAFTEDRSTLPHVELELRQAIERGELLPHFQPVCDLASGAVVGVEALVRWNHPTRGLLPPAAFVGPAEACGLITEVDRIVLQASVDQLEQWVASGIDVWVAVNVSARTLEDPDFAGRVAALIEGHPVARGRLVVEITESAAMRNPEPCAALLTVLRDMGVDSALDDFGMGYSSLAYLKRLPATHLKLDRMFVSGIGQSDRDEGVIELLLDLARKFQMVVIAEGIETHAQLEWLRARSCRFAQGYLLGVPAPAAELRTAAARVSGIFTVRPPTGVKADVVDG